MIDPQTEELASLYVFDLLGPVEKAAFEAQMRFNGELRQSVDELLEAAASVAYAAKPVTPSAGLEVRIWNEIKAEQKVIAFPRSSSWIPWTLAACLAIACGLLFSDLQKTKSLVADQNDLADMRIALLGSKLAEAPQASAVVVWDDETKSGVVKFENVPPLKADQDYQLWVIDPQYPAPVSAGVVPMSTGPEGTSFHPARPIGDAQKFAVSIERKGGVAEVAGPIAMISN